MLFIDAAVTRWVRGIIAAFAGTIPISTVAAQQVDARLPERRLPEEIEVVRTNTAFVTPTGELELDLVPFTFREDNRQKSGVVAEIEYGFFNWLMGEVEFLILWLVGGKKPSVVGLGNIEAALKVQLIASDSFLLAINAEVGFPTSIERASRPRWSAEPALTLSLPASALSVHVELGTEWNEDEGWDEFFGNIATQVHPWDNKVSILLATNLAIEDEDLSLALLPGILVDIEELDLELGFAATVGLTQSAEDWGVIGDIELEF